MIKAIETRYAGCRFRSRLEARWAVFFDHLGIEWEYEKQGFECSARLTLDGELIPYLPDFWFPNLELFGEVKGELDDKSMTRLLNVAACLSSPGGGCGGGHDLVVFGRIPRPGAPVGPTWLHMHKGDLVASQWTGQEGGDCNARMGKSIARDVGGATAIGHECGISPAWITKNLLQGTPTVRTWEIWHDAFQAARSARFEYGESGRGAR